MVVESITGFQQVAGAIALAWYAVILTVAYNGFFEILKKFSHAPSYKPVSDAQEPVTIIRPIKGIDPELSTCLESGFCQAYPRDKIQYLFCVDDPHDESIPVIRQLIEQHPDIDAEILISGGFDENTGSSQEHYGPNPKVNNMAKGFLKAKHDILWLLDSNVWAPPDVLSNSVRALKENRNNGRLLVGDRKVKLVHHVPLALSINPSAVGGSDSEFHVSPVNSYLPGTSGKASRGRFLKKYGAKLDEMFLLTSHLKFYVSLNNLAIAPCVNGKSNLYRRSDLDAAVAKIPSSTSHFFSSSSVNYDARQYSLAGPGNSLKLFARYIGEDNMIAICLWENLRSRTGMTGNFVVQPLSGSDNLVNDYITRRVRWLRVRKYMVLLATLIEPTTESIVCGLYGTFGFSTIFFKNCFIWKIFFLHMLIWVITDYKQYYTLVTNIAKSKYSPNWLKEENIPSLSRPFFTWFYFWIIREVLALPIWIIAMCGHEIEWRGRPFKIKKDLTAAEL